MNSLFEQPKTDQKTLRPHQDKAISLVVESFKSGNRRSVLQGPVGFGKTLVASRITERAIAKGNRVIFTAPAIQLIDQTVSAFEAEGIRDIGVMQANHHRTDPSAMVQVASVQTLARRYIPAASLVIVDECHIRSRLVEEMMATRPDVFFLGLSATPWTKGMGLIWQDLLVPCRIGELIENGYLSEFSVYAPDDPDMSGVKISKGDYAVGQSAQVMSDRGIVGRIVENWLENGENRPTLLFGVNRAHAKDLHEEFTRAGVAAAYVDAFTDSVERKAIERAFRSGEVRVACSVRTLTTGVDWPVSCIIDAAPTQSPALHMQKIGRGLRINPGTEDLIVFDHAGNTGRIALVTDLHFDAMCCAHPGERSTFEKTAKPPTPCGKCGVMFTGVECPQCGYERRRPPCEIEYEDRKLVLVSGASPDSKQDKQKFFGMALRLAEIRGYKSGWAAVKFREKFGTWPRGIPEFPQDPDQAFLNWEKSRRIAYAKSRTRLEGAAA